ncbi:MAG: molybdopterin-dependent oxidoreductase [Anaerolineae bacterium]|nr:molybdopterin-dependent oxidoreductase [Anaerolineae bacterium]
MDERDVTLIVNGQEKRVWVGARTSLLEVLRDQLRLTGTKNGCGEGHCGACTVIVDGQARRACLIRGTGSRRSNIADGMRVETIEGLAQDGLLHPLQQAFIDEGAVQCGFCTPGFIMSAKALLDANPHPSDDDIVQALKRNLCRCTGYASICRAVRRAAGGTVSPPIESATPLHVVGRAVVRPDAVAKVTGAARYTADLTEEAMLHAAVRRSDHAHAIVRAIDIASAISMDGVVAVLTATDIPGARKHGLIRQDWPVLVGEGERVRYLGDAIAVVAAETEAQARAAAQAIAIDYDPQPVIDSPQMAFNEGMPALHDGGNLMHEVRFAKGDVVQGFQEADLVVERTYRTQTQEHAFLEPEASLAVPTANGRIVVYVGSQIPFEDREQIAAMLALPEDDVRVIAAAVGGTFGGKEDIAAQIHAALGAYVTRRPVKLVFTRRESMVVHPKRHATMIQLKMGMTRAGKLVAVEARIDGDTGAYASLGLPVMTRTATHVAGPYDVPHVSVVSRAVYTNNSPSGAFRGFGVPQAAFAVERQIDLMARELGLSPVEVRRKNVLRQGSMTATGQLIRDEIGMIESLDRVVQAVQESGGWQVGVDGDKRRAWGLACGYKNVGLGGGLDDGARAIVQVTDNDRLWVGVGAAEVGQGLVQIVAAMAAETLDIAIEQVDVTVGDTDLTYDCGPTTASRQTFVTGNAVRLAAEWLRARLLRETDLAGFNFAQAVEQARALGLSLREEATYIPPKTTALGRAGDMHFGFGYATQAALVEVDTRTGEVKVLKVISAQDVGRALNPLGLRGQIEGGVVMGIGYALHEEMRFEQGVLLTPTLAQYHLPRIDQVPQIVPIFVEYRDPDGPFGGKGVGELTSIPTAPAIVNGIANATGAQLDALPATPERVLAALQDVNRR